MALNKRRLKGLLEYSDLRNTAGIYGENDVMGVSTGKQMFPTKANLTGVNLLQYKLFFPDSFAYVADTSRRGDKIALAYNNTGKTYIVSTWYVVFKVRDCAKNIVLPEYLFLYFNRAEFDRYTRTNSWGSAREYFWFEDMENIEIELPPISIQQKYVDIYNAMLANQQSYERGLEDLKLVCDAYIDELRRKLPHRELSNYVTLCEDKNDELTFGIDSVRGISIEKRFIETKANMQGVSLKPYLLIRPNEFAYVTVTSRNGEKISLARNDSDETYICSSSYVAFRIKNEEKLLPAFLSMLFERNEFNRYSRFNSWGSARETFDWEAMCEVKIPVPSIEIQRDIVNIFESYNTRKAISEKLKSQIKNICPILIKGSIEEARREA